MVKKAELHVHLEGTIRPEVAMKLAKRNHLPFPSDLINKESQTYFSKDFLHFLQVFDTLAALIKKPEDYYDITFDYLCENARKDTIYTEMMYSPDHAEKSSNIPSIHHLEAIQQAVDDAFARYNIVGRVIMTGVRHFGAESVEKVAYHTAKGTVPCVTGFGLGGDELNYPPEMFIKAYQIVAEEGIPCTVHAGEFVGSEKIWDAINYLPVQRIGHGVKAIESPELMKCLKDRDIALELCPTSNVKLGLFNSFAEHPFPDFLKAGIKVSLNSDDPPFMGTTVNEEYEHARHYFKLDDKALTSITEMAIDSAFVDEITKDELKARLSE